jgi:hypothetical protein
MLEREARVKSEIKQEALITKLQEMKAYQATMQGFVNHSHKGYSLGGTHSRQQLSGIKSSDNSTKPSTNYQEKEPSPSFLRAAFACSNELYSSINGFFDSENISDQLSNVGSKLRVSDPGVGSIIDDGARLVVESFGEHS